MVIIWKKIIFVNNKIKIANYIIKEQEIVANAYKIIHLLLIKVKKYVFNR